MTDRIPYTKPTITDLEVDYATDAARHGWGPRCYEYIEKFEQAFKEHLGVDFSMATSSCTGALHMGLSAMGIGTGDEVIVPDTTWVATAAPIVHLGATPVFVDVLEDTWCIDPKKIEPAITNRTKAIIGVHLYGNLCEMDELLAIGSRNSIPVIEDAAEAMGSVYKGKRAGSMGLFGTFSFHGTKTITTGEGGMFSTNDAELFENVMTLSNHGRARNQPKQFWFDTVGFKYKMSNIQAAIGLGQIQRIDEITQRKREILQYYRDRLEKIAGVSLNPEPADGVNGAWMPTVVLSPELGITRERLQSEFADANVDARVFFYPLSSFDMFETNESNQVAYDLPTRSLNLPSYFDMTNNDLDRISSVIERVANG